VLRCWRDEWLLEHFQTEVESLLCSALNPHVWRIPDEDAGQQTSRSGD
jgi:hypothetical protein